MRLVFRPYKLGSTGCKAVADGLTEKLGYKVWRVTSESNKPTVGDKVINWGSSAEARFPIDVNAPWGCYYSTSKVRTFKLLDAAKVPCPDWTDDYEKAILWKGPVFERKDGLKGGKGIAIRDNGNEVGVADFYTKAIDVAHEYRVHVMDGTIIDFVRKGRRNGEQADGNAALIRNHDNGWIFLRGGVEISDETADCARRAVKALRLDFGAVDIATDKAGNPFVLEVNTAPGLEGTTLKKYIEAFASLASE